MRKLLFALALGMTFIFTSNDAKAQVRFGGGAGVYAINSGDFWVDMPTLTGVKLQGGYIQSDVMAINGGLGYFFPGTVIENDLKFKMIELEVNLNWYFAGETTESFGAYGLLGASFNIGNFVPENDGDYDGEDLSTFSPHINLGIGSTYDLNGILIGAEAKFSLKANLTTNNGTVIDTGYRHGSIFGFSVFAAKYF